MNTRFLGRTNFKISEIGFGSWAIGGGSWGPQNDADSIDALHHAIDLGMNFIDTAAVYGDGKSERLIGQVLRQRKERVFVATKTPPIAGSGGWPPSPYCRAEERYPEKFLRENVEERLRNLNADCLDVLMLHTWTRAWNRDPQPLAVLRDLQREGKIRAIGVSTPEHDQNSVIDLMRGGWVDVVEVIYNIFEQEPAAELLPLALQCNVGIIVRCAFDEGSLTGKWTKETKFAPEDFRSNYFAGTRLARAVERAEKVRETIADSGYTMPQAALKFVLAHPAVTTVIPGIRNRLQAGANCATSDLPPMPEELLKKLHAHNWRHSFW
jgi:aryl-alcohol dehydrogenase-like predicted oxidoreductase